MIGETQEEFLGRVRTALRRTVPHATGGTPVPHLLFEPGASAGGEGLTADLEVARVVGRGAHLVERFLLSVEQAKMVPHRVADVTALVELIAEIAREAEACSALVPLEDWIGREQVEAALQAAGIPLLSPDDLDAGFTADIGITGVAAAVAETGSMYLISGGQRRRLASLAVPIHIGVVDAGQIVPDLLDLWAAPGSEMPASTVLVSAPSKTADIELTLVMGVHGPRVEHVIVVG